MIARSDPLAMLLRMSCRRCTSVFSAALAAGDPGLLHKAWLQIAGPMPVLPQPHRSFRPERTRAATLLCLLRLRPSSRISYRHQPSGKTARPMYRRYLPTGGGDRLSIQQDPRSAPFEHSRPYWHLSDENPAQPVYSYAHALRRTACGSHK